MGDSVKNDAESHNSNIQADLTVLREEIDVARKDSAAGFTRLEDKLEKLCCNIDKQFTLLRSLVLDRGGVESKNPSQPNEIRRSRSADGGSKKIERGSSWPRGEPSQIKYIKERKADAVPKSQFGPRDIDYSEEQMSELVGSQSSLFAKAPNTSHEFTFRKDLREALNSSLRSPASQKKKSKTKVFRHLLKSAKFKEKDLAPPPDNEQIMEFTARDFKLGIASDGADSKSKRPNSPESTSFDSLTFAALDFKFPFSGKKTDRSKGLERQVSADALEREKQKLHKSSSRKERGPVAEGKESVPSIMLAGIPEDGDLGEFDDEEAELYRPTTVNPLGSMTPPATTVAVSDTTGSVTESEDMDESCNVLHFLDWFWAMFFSILHPTGFFRTKWDFYMLLLFAYVCIVAPYIICFGVEFSRYSALGIIETLVDVSFIIDIYLNFRTAYYDDSNKLVIRRRDIAFIYMRTWLAVDLVSVVPFDQLVVNEQLGFVRLFKATRVVKLVKILRLLKIVKMLRLFKIPTLLRHLESAFGRGLLRLVSFMSAAILVTHLVACFFYYSAYLEGYDADTWVTIGQLQNSSNFDKYVTALYWSMSTLTTVGYGDVTPGNANEKIMSMVGMVVGVTVFAYFMGSMSAMMSSINSSNTRITRKLMAVEDFLRQRKVPPNLAERVRTFFNYILSRQIIVEETSIINELSLPLRTEVVLYLYREALERLPFFQGKDPQFIVHIVTSLKLEYYAPGEVVIRQGDPGNVMYFVGNGRLEVRLYYEGSYDAEDCPVLGENMKASEVPVTNLKPKMNDETYNNTLDLINAWRNVSMFGPSESYQKLGMLYTGEYFGEYSCLLGECRTATVVAQEYCELYSLSRTDLDEILEDLPELGKVFLKMVEGYVQAGFASNLLNHRLQNRMDNNDKGMDPVLPDRRGPRKTIVEKIMLQEQGSGSLFKSDSSEASLLKSFSGLDGHQAI
ncbi:hypothetical protein BSKO_07908 [Bryopsis sp. KO-2023]|nr:hypothetical protein BSKO_07908 [Bryopsis sp. KO-2023]